MMVSLVCSCKWGGEVEGMEVDRSKMEGYYLFKTDGVSGLTGSMGGG